MTRDKTRVVVRWVVAVVAVLVGASGHVHGHRLVLDRLNTDSPAVGDPVGPVTRELGPPKPADRVVVVIVDGLGHDESQDLPSLKILRGQGVSRVLVAAYPSFTYPGITSLATGRPPEHSGVRINNDLPDLSWDSVSRVTAVDGRVLYDPGSFPPVGDLLQLPNEAERITWKPGEDLPRATLTWLYVGEVDEAGHADGADSEAYRRAARRADAFVGAVAEQLDFRTDALVVVSDHGHLARGGHGGVEPEVLRAVFVAAGGPFRRDVALDPAPMHQVAATLTAVLGKPAPKDALGAPLVDTWSADAQPPRVESMATPARDFAPMRLLAAMLAVVATLALVLLAHWRRWLVLSLRDFLPSMVYLGVFVPPYLLAGYGLTWSIPRGELGFTLETGLMLLVGLVLAVLVARRTRRVEEAAAAVLVYGLPYLFLSVWHGLDMTSLSPPLLSFAIIVVATLEFYLGLAFGVRAMFVPRNTATKGT